MNMKHHLVLLAAALMIVGCREKEYERGKPEIARADVRGPGAERAEPETLVREFDEVEMDAAMAKAKSKVEEFVTALAAKDADSYSVKVPITEGEQTEYFWMVNVSYKDGVFYGQIGNEPGMVSKVKNG